GFDWWFNFGAPNDDFYAGTYAFQFTVTDQVTSCFTKDTSNIFIIAEPSLTANSTASDCEGQPQAELLNLFNVSNNAPSTSGSKFVIRSFNGDTTKSKWGTAFINGHFLKGTPKAGTWLIDCKYTEKGCSDNIQSNLVVNHTPKVSFTTDPKDSAGVNAPYFNTNNQSSIASGENVNYKWYMYYPNNNSISGFAPQLVYPTIDSFYTIALIGTTDKGCADTFTHQVKVGQKTNAISNLDISNIKIDQHFRVMGWEKGSTMRVYDASGKLLGTDKTNQGLDFPTGIYFYQLELQVSKIETVVLSGKMAIASE
ncbi:MAG: hypothetical protein IT244_05760, partial [Bacteroidia bacterium]|nr:hypothetical protein [Bacteroidia bacterium]